MIRLTIRRCMHDRKIPNITSSATLPPVFSSFESPRKFDYHKPTKKEEPSKWRRIWPKFRVHSLQYRGYKATYGDGTKFTDVAVARMRHQFDCEKELWTKARPHEHAESEEQEAIWGEIDHDYVHLEGEENV